MAAVNIISYYFDENVWNRIMYYDYQDYFKPRVLLVDNIKNKSIKEDQLNVQILSKHKAKTRKYDKKPRTINRQRKY